MSHTRILIHYVWSTKYREPTLIAPYRQQLFDHIKQNALLKDIHLDIINGYVDHVHCIVSLRPGQTIDHVAQQLKGESAFWFNNRSGIKDKKLHWQDHYFAVGLDLGSLEKVRAYIRNQELHHKKKTFEAEYNQLMKKYLFTKDLDNSGDHFILNTSR